ncbi:hypothetical protein ACE5IS_08655 [Leptospira wolffii]|uniref:Uncharacterized protein n=1 Tax=Leptospira wolffii TaxID=409998 RepID=A0ABV5BMY0_9LEPT
MHYFPAFFKILFDFQPAVLPSSVWIDGEVLALGSVSLALLSLFGYVVHSQIDRKSVPEEPQTVSDPEVDTKVSELPVFESVSEETTIFDSKTYFEKEENTEEYHHSFYLPIHGKTLEAVRMFLESIPSGSDSWEVLLRSSSGKLETAATRSGNLFIFPSERKEALPAEPGTMVWPLQWESASLGELRRKNEIDSVLPDLNPALDRLIEGLILGGESQDTETGWGSYSFFAQTCEREKETGEEPKILIFLEFTKSGDLAVEFRSFGRWWKERFGDSNPLSRVRKNRLAAILSPEDWIRFQESLSGLMEFLGPDKVSLNVGASVRIRRSDSEWEPKAKRALHSSKEEGPNRLVCL